MTTNKKKTVIAILLGVLGSTLYLQTLGFDFINLDDNLYVYENPHIREGLTLWGLKSAFFGEKYLWIPLVWVSFMLDFELWGLDPTGYHLTNLLFHGVNSALVFLVLTRLTETSKRSLWPSAFVGAVFAVHPLHVESVVWITERKDVLFALFWILAMWAYLRYVESPSIRRYLLVFALFTFSIMSKPMAVTLPLALLLLDYWPLGRLRRGRDATGLVIEKLPFFVLSLGCAAITMLLAQKGGAVVSMETVPLSERIPNALISYLKYIKMALYPVDLAVFYPHPRTHTSLLGGVVAALVLVVITAAALLNSRKRPYIIVGWFWFLITLIPAIGIIQSGAQALADRFMYLPLIGLSIIAAWGVPDLVRGPLRLKSTHLYAASALVITAFTVLSLYQIRHWQNSITVFTHALEVTDSNFVAHSNLGNAYYRRGEILKAEAHFKESIATNPAHSETYYNYAVLLAEVGKPDEALKQYRTALAINPNNAEAHNNIGTLLASAGELDSAEAHFRIALRITPRSSEAHTNMGTLLSNKGEFDSAISHFEEALRINPRNTGARQNLDNALSRRNPFD